MGIEPTLAAWKAAVLPLNYTRESKATQPGFANARKTNLKSLLIAAETLVEGVGFEPT